MSVKSVELDSEFRGQSRSHDKTFQQVLPQISSNVHLEIETEDFFMHLITHWHAKRKKCGRIRRAFAKTGSGLHILMKSNDCKTKDILQPLVHKVAGLLSI